MMLRSWWLLSGWSVPQPNQSQAHHNGPQAEADPDSLERPESTPLTGAHEVHSDNAEDAEDTEGGYEDTELTFGDHKRRGF
jgi:hypothetical protein